MLIVIYVYIESIIIGINFKIQSKVYDLKILKNKYFKIIEIMEVMLLLKRMNCKRILFLI